MDISEPATLAILGALAVGVVLGGVMHISQFCLRTAFFAEAVSERIPQARQWLVALIVAVVGTQALLYFTSLDLEGSIYRLSVLSPIALMVGGFCFGAGMILARGCLARQTVLLAGGNLRSLVVVIVAGLVAYATSRGILAYPRLGLESLLTVSVADSGLWTGITLATLLAFAFLLARTAFSGKRPEHQLKYILAGAFVGLAVPAAFAISGIWALDEFDPQPAESLRFTLPLGESLLYLLIHTGTEASFAIALIGGTIAGAGLSALARQEFSWRSYESPRQMLRSLAGATLMGFGGVLALGCTIGQGLSGLAALSPGVVFAVPAILLGGYSMRRLDERQLLRQKTDPLGCTSSP